MPERDPAPWTDWTQAEVSAVLDGRGIAACTSCSSVDYSVRKKAHYLEDDMDGVDPSTIEQGNDIDPRRRLTVTTVCNSCGQIRHFLWDKLRPMS